MELDGLTEKTLAVDFSKLAEGTRLLIQTKNTLYTYEVGDGADAGLIMGHDEFCPKFLRTSLQEPVAKGLNLRFAHPNERWASIITTPIQEITIEEPSDGG